MDKLGTIWAPPHSISTTFRVKIVNDTPLVCASARGERIYTETCGLGWRFSMLRGNFGHFIALEYDAHFAHRGLGTVQVFASLKAEGSGENDCCLSETRLAEPGKRTVIASWTSSMFSKYPILVFTVTLRDPIDGPPPSTDLAPAIRAALGTSVCTGTFIDTRFFVYSRRASSGRVWNPLPIYGNGLLLSGKSDYLRMLLCVEGFAESTPGDIRGAFPRDSDSFTDTYDYESDSDLDDVDDVDADDWDSSAQVALTRRPGSNPPANPPNTSSTAIPFEHTGRTIHIKDMAFRTWHSLVFYLYTGDITFLPLKSDPTRSRQVMTDKHLAEHPHDPPPCSPKSMYRLAEKLGLEELEQLSFQAIRAGLSAANILPEAFSRFSARYAAVSEMEVDLLVGEHYDSPAVAAAFTRTMGAVVEGDMPHAAGVLGSIFERLARRGRPGGAA